MAVNNKNKLNIGDILYALDRRDLEYYNRLSDDEKKDYSPLVLMRCMSSLNGQNPNAAYAILMTNDLVNIGFWNLTKHPELQHKLLCLTGLGSKQFRPWLATKSSKRINKLDTWLIDRFPDLNEDEIEILKSSHDSKSWAEFVKSSGISDKEVKDLIEAWKKYS